MIASRVSDINHIVARFFALLCAHWWLIQSIRIDTVKLQFGTANLINWKYDNGAQFNVGFAIPTHTHMFMLDK